MTKAKSIIFLLPGAKTVHPPLINQLADKFYNHYRVNTTTEAQEYLNRLKKYLQGHTESEVQLYNWSGGVTTLAVHRAASQLTKFLRQKNHYETIKLFGLSMGGNVIKLAVSKKYHLLNIQKVICVGTPHLPGTATLPNNTEVINVYSKDDDYIDFANKILYLGRGRKILAGAKNIVLTGLRHGDYIKNPVIQYNGNKITTFQLFKSLLD